MTTEIMSTEEVGAYIGRPPTTLRFWRHVNEGPACFKLGRRVMYRKADVDAWIEQQYRATVRGEQLTPRGAA